MKTIHFIGAGNVATHMAEAFDAKAFDINSVWSRKEENAILLAEKTKAKHLRSPKEIEDKTSFIIVSVPDNALDEILQDCYFEKAILLHTSGTLPMEALAKYASNYGVIYPLQSFSKTKETDFSTVPILYEGKTAEISALIKKISQQISNTVLELDSDRRKYYHLAAVFSCNFVNHLFHITQHICEKEGIEFSLLLPLIKETVDKIRRLPAAEAQTGPAFRNDTKVLEAHINALEDDNFKQIYMLLSTSIQKMKNEKL